MKTGNKAKSGSMFISLLTDFGLKDNFVGVMKAVVLNINSGVQIVDITHSVGPQDVIGGAFLLKSSYRFFPGGTIHLAVVDPGVGSLRRAVIVKTKNYYFVGPDNGILDLASKDDGIEKVVTVTSKNYFLEPLSQTFHGRDIFAPVSAHLSKGVEILKFGPLSKDLKALPLPKVRAEGGALKGEIIYIDRFGNLISNISRQDFLNFTRSHRFKIIFNKSCAVKLCNSYNSVRRGDFLGIFGSFQTLEISINQGSAYDYFGLGLGAKLEIGIA